MQFLRIFFVRNWHSIALYGALFAVIGCLLVWQLHSLLPGYSQEEAATYSHAISFDALLANPLNAPFLLAIKAASYLFEDTLLAGRAVAAISGMAVLVLFCWLLRQWHTRTTALMGTLLFGTSAWFLHIARMGTPEILLLSVFVLAGLGYWLKESRSWQALLACFVAAAAALYVPGAIWFIVAGIVWQWRTIDYIFKKHLLTVSVGGLVFLAALAPLGYGFYKDHSLAMQWLALPASWPAPLELVREVLKVPYHLLVTNAENPTQWLGTAPVLDVFSLAMFACGVFLYVQRFKLLRTPLFATIGTVGIVLIALGGGMSLTVLIPFVYVIIAAGVHYVLQQWLTVFPRNPIARSIGYGVMALVVALACAYHFRHYFVAWPHAQATHDSHQVPDSTGK